MKIEKKATKTDSYRRNFVRFNNARDAWSNILETLGKQYPKTTLILPSYIGWSQNEGSGIFDPVIQSNLPFAFYALNKHLKIDISDLKKSVLACSNKPIVLLVHYFGFPDINYNKITNWLGKNQIVFIEDSAHAMLTDLIGGVCGRKGIYNIYSLHKMMPLKSGGILVYNKIKDFQNRKSAASTSHSIDVFDYDLKMIYDKRRHNYLFLLDLLKEVKGLKPLYPVLASGICPQTMPIIIRSENRDHIYFEMNKRGFGLVSLYHTMIKQLKDSSYDSVNFTSKHLINLPIHQDCDEKELIEMVANLQLILNT